MPGNRDRIYKSLVLGGGMEETSGGSADSLEHSAFQEVQDGAQEIDSCQIVSLKRKQ